MNTDELLQAYRHRKAAMETSFKQYESTWRLIRDYLGPRQARFDGEDSNPGQRKDQAIINTKPLYAIRTLASGMQMGVTNQTKTWFTLNVPDLELNQFHAVRAWLDEVAGIMRGVLSRSNIYDRLRSIYQTLGLFGTGALFIEQDEEDICRGYNLLFGTFMVESNRMGRVDTIHRKLMMPVSKMVEKFGIERLSDAQKLAYDRGDYNRKFEVCHIVEPNINYKPNKYLPQYKAYTSVWYDAGRSGNEAIYKISGYDDTPMAIPRWDIVGDDPWGVGCGELALGDCLQLQHMEKRKLQGLDKWANPHMIADASMRNERINLLPGQTSYVNGLITGQPGLRPAFQINNAINEFREEIYRIEEHIDEAFYKDLFLIISSMDRQTNITATQIMEMKEEKLLMLGPVVERLNDELYDLLISRVFNLINNAGMLPPPPSEIEGKPIKVEYTSILAQAQKALGVQNIERYVGFVGNMAQIKPESIDRLNIDEIIEEYADAISIPNKLIVPDEEANQVREQRAAMQQQQVDMEQNLANVNIAKTMSDTNLQGNSALMRAMELAGAA